MQRKVEVLVIGSGFGGAIAARRLAEAGVDVLVLERGPWRDTVPNRSLGLQNLAPLPQGARAYTHGLRNIGSHRLKKDLVLNCKGFIEAYQGDGINVICSSGVGGGSHVYAGFMDRPLVPDYWDNRHPDLCNAQMEGYYEELLATYKARPLTDSDQVPNAIEQTSHDGKLRCLGHPAVAFLMPQVPGQPARRVEDGVERWECDMANNSFLGSPSGAKTTLDFSTLWPAMQKGLQVQALCEVTSIHRLSPDRSAPMRYEVRYRNHANGRDECILAEHVILAAGGLSSVRLLLRSRDQARGLTGMPRLGLGFGGNGDYFGLWKENSDKDLSKGMPIGSPFRLKDSPNQSVLVLRAAIQGIDSVPMPGPLRRWLRRQSVIIAFGGDRNTGTMALHKGRFKITYDTRDNDIYRQIDAELGSIQKATGTKVYAPRNPVTVHPVGGACLGASIADGVVGANGEVFDNPGLYVADASALPASPGGAPSLTIAAWSANVADRLITRLRQHDSVASSAKVAAATKIERGYKTPDNPGGEKRYDQA